MNRFARRLDRRLDEIELFHELTDAEEIEFIFDDGALKDLESNMTLQGTTASMIARREADFGVPIDDTMTLDERRSVIVAKYRGQGTTTPTFIKNVARSFKYGEIDLNETDNPYHIVITFKSIFGIPSNMTAFKSVLEEVKPAHIIFEYVYRYITWDDYERYNKNQDEWDALNLTWDNFESYDGKERV